MFGYSFFFALASAVFIAVCELANERDRRPISVGTVTLVTNFLLNLIILYSGLIPFTHFLVGGYPLLLFLDTLIAVIVSWLASDLEGRAAGAGFGVWAAGLVIWLLVMGQFTQPGLVCDNPGYDRMAALTQTRILVN